jgi:curli biogenesis system outer membrane secretion channel CsgG
VKRRLSLVAFLVCLAATASLSAQKTPTLTAEQARDHVGQTAKVCGQVVRVHLAFKTRGQPTFLDFERPHPHAPFTAVIWGLDRGKFGDPQQQYLNKHICVTGPIRAYRSKPEIFLHSPKQITEK